MSICISFMAGFTRFFYLWVSGSRQDWKWVRLNVFESTICWLQKNTREIWRYQKESAFCKPSFWASMLNVSFRGVMPKKLQLHIKILKQIWKWIFPPQKNMVPNYGSISWKHGSLANHLMNRMVTRNQKLTLKHLWGQGLTWICSQWPLGSSLYGPGWPRRM